jgi:hypothetical protein
VLKGGDFLAIKTWTICQMNLVVKQLDPMVANYQKVFPGIPVKIFNIPKTSEVPSFTDGKQGDYSDCRLAVLEFDNLVLEITEPGKSDSPWKRWLDAHGEGVEHIGFKIAREDKDEAFKTLESCGSKLYHAGFYPGGTYAFVDGFKSFGFDFNIKWDADNREEMERWKAHPEEKLKGI